MWAVDKDVTFESRENRIKKALKRAEDMEAAVHAAQHHSRELHRRLPPTTTPYPLWPQPLRQPPHVKVPKQQHPAPARRRTQRASHALVPPLALGCGPAGAPPPSALGMPGMPPPPQQHEGKEGELGAAAEAKEDEEEEEEKHSALEDEDDHVLRCAFGSRCRGNSVLAKNAPATVRCYTCAKYTAGGTGLYCGLCFEERHPWYRVAHVSMALSDTRDATLEWESHVRSAQGEQLLREFASLLALTTQFKGEVRAMGAQTATADKVGRARKEANKIEAEIRDIMQWIQFGGGSPEERKKRAAALKLQGMWRIRAARIRLHALIRGMYSQFEDPETGQLFYYNKATGETTWIKPHGLGEEELDAEQQREKERKAWKRKQRRGRSMSREEAALHIQGRWRTRVARRLLHDMLCGAYVKIYDPSAGRCYFFNKRTGATTWETPPGVTDEELLSPRSFKRREEEQARARRPVKVRDHAMTQAEAALVVQGMYRRRTAFARLHALLTHTYEKVLDEASGRYYYHNVRTDKVTWVPPPGCEEAELLTPRSFAAEEAAIARRALAAEKASEDPMTPDEAATVVQNAWRCREARQEMADAIHHAYTKVVDPDRGGVTYYFNRLTGTTRWNKPALLADDDDVDEWDEALDGDIMAEVNTHRVTLRVKKLTELEAVLLVQNAWRNREARLHMLHMVQRLYERVVDEETGKVFYCNVETGESRWSKPFASFLGDAEILTPRAREREEAAQGCEAEARAAAVSEARLAAQRRAAEQRRAARRAAGPPSEGGAATRIQALARGVAGRRAAHDAVAKIFEKVFDPNVGACYYYNTKTGESFWEKPPALLGDDLVETPRSQLAEMRKKAGILQEQMAVKKKRAAAEAERQRLAAERHRRNMNFGELSTAAAVLRIQGAWRQRLARRKAAALVRVTYEKDWDPATQAYFYFNRRTQQSIWVKPLILERLRMDAPEASDKFNHK